MGRAEEQPLLAEQPPASETPFFNNGPRVRRDGGWLTAFLLSLAVVVAGGVWLGQTRTPDFATLVSYDHLSNPASCPVDAPGRRMLLADTSDDEKITLKALLAHPVGSITGTLAGSIALGFLFVQGFQHSAHVMVNVAITLQMAIPLGAAVAFFVQGMTVGGIIMLAIAALYIWVFVTWREQIGLVTRLLGVTGAGLVANKGLIVVSLITPLIWGALLVPAGVFALFAVSNGQVVPNSARSGPPRPDPHGAPTCVDEDGNSVLCCTWQVDPAGIVYLTLLGVALTWSSCLLSVIRSFTVAGATTQWYFAPAAPGGSAVTKAKRGRVLTSLGHALGPSIGSLCAAAALLTVVQYMRQALDACEKKARDTQGGLVVIVVAIVAAILRVLLALVEFINRFAVVRMAMTGDAFGDASRDAVSLLKRNALDAFGIWWLPPFILQNCALMLSVAFGMTVWGTSRLLWAPGPHDGSSVLLGVAAGILAALILSFFCSLLLNVLDAVFVCFAIDRDTARVTRQDVYTIMSQVPGVGQVVQNPDGNIAYGAPGAPPPAQYPPAQYPPV